jgi:hypothetical protein
LIALGDSRDRFRDRFIPRTPHLAWLGQGAPRDDKVLTPEGAEEMLARDLVVEEEVDGADLGFSVGDDAELRAQNRGSDLTPERSHPQFKPLWSWPKPRQDALVDSLWPELMLFGEWCHAVHSLRYDRLPDWFLGFDVYGRSAGKFWDTARRDALLAGLGLHPVPRVGNGRYDLPTRTTLLGASAVGRVRRRAWSCAPKATATHSRAASSSGPSSRRPSSRIGRAARRW